MYPHERSLVRLLAGKPFAIVGVNNDENLVEIREVVKAKKINWRSFWESGDQANSISSQWCIASRPSTFLIDASGKIRYRNLDGKSLDTAIEELMRELGHPVSLVGVDHESADAKLFNSESDE